MLSHLTIIISFHYLQKLSPRHKMSETEKIEAPPVYDTLTSIATPMNVAASIPKNDQTTSTTVPAYDVVTSIPTSNQTTSNATQVPDNVSSTKTLVYNNTTSAPAPVYDTLAPLQTNQDTTEIATTTAPTGSSEMPFKSTWDQVC